MIFSCFESTYLLIKFKESKQGVIFFKFKFIEI